MPDLGFLPRGCFARTALRLRVPYLASVRTASLPSSQPFQCLNLDVKATLVQSLEEALAAFFTFTLHGLKVAQRPGCPETQRSATRALAVYAFASLPCASGLRSTRISRAPDLQARDA